ncbi:uncharacterized protein ELE39_003242 [Cryptosporidium sp. chipmunk genotype I]|uniref:uncharacterized protein n=1 Tax=Cryptosporidium sp. chipmunk genotype I TaxID=1280935 RepID=UPI00351AA2E2|nr:hypothetical protein ELE39_003242 [Cryptosporidium sp. chipmunk genotype I]
MCITNVKFICITVHSRGRSKNSEWEKNYPRLLFLRGTSNIMHEWQNRSRKRTSGSEVKKSHIVSQDSRLRKKEVR